MKLPMWKVITIILAGMAERQRTMVHGWMSIMKNIQTAASDCRSMAVRESLPIREKIQKCKDYSEAYQAGYHEYMAHMLERRPWIFCSYVWNMFDFGCAARSEGGVTGRNNKGLVTMDRKLKRIVFTYTRRTGIQNRWFISVISGIRSALGKIPKSACIQIRKE